jgi:phosphoribosylanthranilate isomerase
MFRVKICGITSDDDAGLAVSAGADAIGLNFYEKSPRRVTLDLARRIAKALPARICKVGVFVNAPVDRVRHAMATVGLDLAQLHGDETPAQLRELVGVPVMKAFRVASDLAAIGEYLRHCRGLGWTPRMVLVDACREGQYGGTGATVDWPSVAASRTALAGVPLILAGGLTPDNVAAAIGAVRPWGVDVASGVEVSAGKKSKELVERFVANANAALSGPRSRG